VDPTGGLYVIVGGTYVPGVTGPVGHGTTIPSQPPQGMVGAGLKIGAVGAYVIGEKLVGK
jgi:hypothetical protein